MFQGKRIVKIEEEGKSAGSPYVIIGVYFYDETVFDRVRPLRPSGRGELEITDVNNSYLLEGKLEHEIIEGEWTDAGTLESLTLESLWRTTKMVREKALLAEDLALAAASRKQLFVSPSQSDQKPVSQRTNGGLHDR